MHDFAFIVAIIFGYIFGFTVPANLLDSRGKDAGLRGPIRSGIVFMALASWPGYFAGRWLIRRIEMRRTHVRG